MYLHLGGDFSVRVAEVSSILDYEAMKKSEPGRAFLAKRRKNLRDYSDGKPKSAVVIGETVFLSALSPMTLKKRAEEFEMNLSPKTEV